MRVQEDWGMGSTGRFMHWCYFVGNRFVTVNQEPQKIKFQWLYQTSIFGEIIRDIDARHSFLIDSSKTLKSNSSKQEIGLNKFYATGTKNGVVEYSVGQGIV